MKYTELIKSSHIGLVQPKCLFIYLVLIWSGAVFNNVDFLFITSTINASSKDPMLAISRFVAIYSSSRTTVSCTERRWDRWHKSALADLQNKSLDHSLSKCSIVSGRQDWAKLKKIISELYFSIFFMGYSWGAEKVYLHSVSYFSIFFFMDAYRPDQLRLNQAPIAVTCSDWV